MKIYVDILLGCNTKKPIYYILLKEGAMEFFYDGKDFHRFSLFIQFPKPAKMIAVNDRTEEILEDQSVIEKIKKYYNTSDIKKERSLISKHVDEWSSSNRELFRIGFEERHKGFKKYINPNHDYYEIHSLTHSREESLKYFNYELGVF